MLHVECLSCGASAETVNHADPDSAVECGCCLEDHNHGQAANETGVGCRPVRITFTGPMVLRAAAG